MKSLFAGSPAENLLYPFQSMSRDERENVHLILDSVRRFFAENVDPAQIDRDARISDHVIDGMKHLGLFGMTVPVNHGGIGLSASAFARVIEEIAWHDTSSAVLLAAHQSIGFEALLRFGSESQKRRYLPKLATGQLVAAAALTEPGAGSDAFSLRTRADLAPDGANYVVNGIKSWVSNAHIADVFTVFVRTAPGMGDIRPRITALLVEKGDGVVVGEDLPKLGVRGVTTPQVSFENVRVPASNVIGDVPDGFRIAMRVLTTGRLSLAAGAVGACKRLIRMSTDRARDRRAFGRRIGEFEMIQDKISWMMAQTWALESMVYLTTGMVDHRNADDYIESAAAKLFASQTLWTIASEALQIAGASGYSASLPYERLLRDARVLGILQGTDEILRYYIALRGVSGVAQTKDGDLPQPTSRGKLAALSGFALQRARQAIGRHRLGRVHAALRPEAEVFSAYAAHLGEQAERAVRVHGKELVDREMVQRRLADVSVDLFALASCLSRTTSLIERYGESGAEKAIAMTRMFTRLAAARMQQNTTGLASPADEPWLDLAQLAYREGGYPFDMA